MSLMERARWLFCGLRNELTVYRLVARHPRTPRISRILLGIAVAYAISPIDLIPDFIPVVGHLDDAILLPMLVWIALRFLPHDLIRECRAQAQSQGSSQPGVVADGHASISVLTAHAGVNSGDPVRAGSRARG